MSAVKVGGGKEPREVRSEHLCRKGKPDRRLRRQGLDKPRLHGRRQGRPACPLPGAGYAARIAAWKLPPVEGLAKEKEHPGAIITEAGIAADVLLDPVGKGFELEEGIHEADLVEHHLET